jgi:PAS domain S-box-containing protein
MNVLATIQAAIFDCVRNDAKLDRTSPNWRITLPGEKRSRDQLLAENDELRNRLKQMEDRLDQLRKLSHSDPTLRQLGENPLVGVWQADFHGCFLFINHRLSEMSGYSQEEAVGMSMLDVIAPEQKEWLVDRMKIRQAGQAAPDIVECEFVRKDGSRFAAVVVPAASRDVDGKVNGFVGALIDITERKKAEDHLRRYHQELSELLENRTLNLKTMNQKLQKEVNVRLQKEKDLHESTERFRDLADLLPQTVFEMDIGGLLTFANRQAFRVFGYTQEDFDKGIYALDMLVPEDKQRARETIERVLKGEDVSGTEYRARDKEGKTFPVIIYSSPILRDGRPAGLRGIITDITERKRLETELRWSQKMETVGRLAGGVAHDFNNLLTTIIGYSELGLSRSGSNKLLHADLQIIKEASERAAKLTQQLLAFSRRQVTEPKIISVNKILIEMDKMLRRLIGEDIELECVANEPLGKIRIDPSQLEQIIVNLSVNARDAMPSGGTLSFETSNAFVEQSFSARYEVIPGNYVRLSVEDTGVGMSGETLEHVFEPFFTTKEPGQGTGLGLATCYGIVKQNGGYIQVESQPCSGTKFTIYFPRVEGDATMPAQKKVSETLPGGKESILLVEDDNAVRSLAARVLRERGYLVIEAANGDEALKRVDDIVGEGSIDLLLSDLVMPKMSGKDLADKLQARRPGLKVLFVSGYPGESITRQRVLEPRFALLQKPFSPEELTRKVRECLDGSSGDFK